MSSIARAACATKRFNNVTLRQLRSLQRAYGGSNAPELLIFGDSNMVWTNWGEPDRRHLVDLIGEELGSDVTLEALVGPGYNPRMVMAFLSALEKCPAKPRVVLVPASVMMATSSWLSHPVLGYGRVAQELRESIKTGCPLSKNFDEPEDAEWEAYDKQPAPTLIGARRTIGELRLITNAVPTTRWQHLVRLRHMLEYYNAERLEKDSEGVGLIADMARMLADLRLPSVAYISPINFEVADKLMGATSRQHISHNADVIATTYRYAAGPLGTVVDATFACPGNEFSDPLHLTEAGRQRLAGMIASAVRSRLNPAHETSEERGLVIEDNFDPAAHYDRVTEAWRLLLGQDLHYGVFATGSESRPRPPLR